MRGTRRRSVMKKVTTPSDPVADVSADVKRCPQCGGTTQLDQGTCINCFLRAGIEGKGERSREAFESILLEANVTDTTGVLVTTKFWKRSGAAEWGSFIAHGSSIRGGWSR